jgi:predicted TPR repeat methyltransferase
MYPAHAGLARLATAARNDAEALEHAAMAAEIAPWDGVMHAWHGDALAASGQTDAAIQAYLRAIKLEPYWADPYLPLAIQHEAAGSRDAALAAYRAYLERAPRRQANGIGIAERRIAALQQQR